MKYKVTMICKEIWRAEAIVEDNNCEPEIIKDKAWALFDVLKKIPLEQENYTKVEQIEDK